MMKRILAGILLTALLGISVFAAPPTGLPVAGERAIAPMVGTTPLPARDDSDEDSVYFSYGFENGWNGWTTVDLTDAGVKWHTTQTHAFSGSSWWAGDEEFGGYQDHWLQYLDSPTLDLRGQQNLRLKFMAYWSVEQAAGDIPEPYNGWDGCNVWISTDNGRTWSVITPTTPEYTRSSLYSFGFEWGMGPDIPGWTDNSGDADWPAAEWVPAEFNLDRYNNIAQAKIRWAFCSDPGWHTGEQGDENNQAWGFLVDSLRVMAGNNTLWQNNGDAQGNMTMSAGAGAGDFWEITDDDAHDGRYSAHCPIRHKLQNALVSPALDIPEVGWYTYFDFWVRADTRNYDPDGNNQLDDLFDVQVSSDQRRWERIIYDYGRDEDWQDNFHYFGPDTTFNAGLPEWKMKLNLTQWAGERVWLRWRFLTDSTVEAVEVEGTGLYIDDVRLNITRRRQNDVGVQWLRVGFPTALGFSTPSRINVRNYGLGSQVQVQKFYRVGASAAFPIVPWGPMEPDEIIENGFSISANRLTYADSIDFKAYTVVNTDTTRENDTAYARGVLVYPQGLWNLGYDDREYRLRYNYDRGTGAMIRFTPVDDRIQGAFDLKALRVRWNGEQNSDAQVRLHIYRDARGELGEQIYNELITVTRDDCIPNIHSIDLSAVAALQRLQTNFWVWFEIQTENHWPQIIGDEEAFGRGHYFLYDGQDPDTVQAEWQVHAFLMQGGASPVNMLLAGRTILDFDTVDVGSPQTMRVALFNGGVNTVSVRSARSDNNQFRVEPFDETELDIGDVMTVNITFLANSAAPAAARLTFVSSDNTPPMVELRANGGVVSVGEDIAAPAQFHLGEAYPNPFNATTVIPFSIAAERRVRIAVYDLSGRMVEELVNEQVTAGEYRALFTAENLSTGFYFCRMEAGDFSSVRKLILVK